MNSKILGKGLRDLAVLEKGSSRAHGFTYIGLLSFTRFYKFVEK